MPVTIFKPNKSKSGSLITLSFNSKEQVAYIGIVKQVGDMNKSPFKGSKFKTSIQLSLSEIGAFLNVLEKKVKFNTVHKSDSGQRIINFDPYFVEVTGNNLDDEAAAPKKELKGFSLYTKLNDQQFKCGFNLNEARVFAEWLKFVLVHSFSAIYAEDKKRALEFKKTQENPQEENI